MTTGDQILECPRCGTSYYQATRHKCRPKLLPAYKAVLRFISERESIVDGIISQRTEATLAQMSEIDGKHIFRYIDINEARKVIKSSIRAALKQYDVVASKCKVVQYDCWIDPEKRPWADEYGFGPAKEPK